MKRKKFSSKLTRERSNLFPTHVNLEPNILNTCVDYYIYVQRVSTHKMMSV